MKLKNAAFFALVGTAMWTVLTAVNFVRSLSGVTGGYLPAVGLLTSFVEFIAALSLLIFFGVFYSRES